MPFLIHGSMWRSRSRKSGGDPDENVSAQELNFHGQDITDRFVRGDMSRNTEGSGLGLAIVKALRNFREGSF